MKYNGLVYVAAALLLAPAAFGSWTTQDGELNVNGTDVAGLTASGVTTTGLNSTNGLGSLVWTDKTAGAFNFDAWVFDVPTAVNAPDFDEYGKTGGSVATGESWQIDVPDYDNDSNHPSPDILANTEANTLDNTNHLPGSASNFNGNCSGANCNDIASFALGFSGTLASGYTETVTLSVSSVAPASGFYEEILNATTGDINYLSGTAVATPNGVVSGTPEPGSFLLVGGLLAGFATYRVRRARAAR